MRRLKQLSPQDVFFVGGETHNVYQHTAGLVILDNRGGSELDFEKFRQHLIDRLGRIPQFRWKLHQVPLGLDLPYWVEDEDFSFDHHIRRIAVPSPGDHKALGSLVAYIYSRHLDRDHPLWETWFIEGLADGKCAMLQKLHHCLMDGEGARRLGEAISDFEPNAAPREIDPALTTAEPGEVPEFWRQSLMATNRLTALPWKAGKELRDILRGAIRKRFAQPGASAKKVLVPVACFNHDIGSQRGFVFGALSLEDIKAVKNQFDVTVNDVLLAIVSGALRRYLAQQSELPERSLRTSIAVSIRKEGDEEFSNRVTDAIVTLASDIADPLQRLRTIAEDTEQAKRRARSRGKGLLQVVQILPPSIINMLVQMIPPEQYIEMYGTNLLVSTVRGSSRATYMCGARAEGTYPMSIIIPGSGLNITCVSYVDDVDFGVTYDPDLFPEAWSFIDALKDAGEEYSKLLEKPRRKKKKSSRVVRAVPKRHGSGKSTARAPARKATKPGARAR